MYTSVDLKGVVRDVFLYGYFSHCCCYCGQSCQFYPIVTTGFCEILRLLKATDG